MNPFDLERELASLRPVRPSAVLTARIGKRLAHRPVQAGWRLVAAASVLAACVLLVPAWNPKPSQRQAVVPPAPAPTTPALAHYRQAFNESPEELERLFDCQAIDSAEEDVPRSTLLTVHSLLADQEKNR